MKKNNRPQRFAAELCYRLLVCLVFLSALFALLATRPVAAQSVENPETDNSVEAELASFKLAEGYQVALFADETNGIANPIAMRFDAAGRLWVLCTWAYPQLKPQEVPNDKLLILEDTDGDGRADKTSVYIDGLNMPTGFALGDGGVYIGHGTELLHVRDTDGDGRADEQRVVLTGFGTGDTHQNINSFEWTPGGELVFCQGLHSFSRVETPWGIQRADEGAVWRLRTRRMQLEPFMSYNMCSVNPWGIQHDRWGRMFLKSNDPELWFVSPAMIRTYQYLSLRQYGSVGRTFSKSMAIDIVETGHLPDDLQGHAIIAGYFAHLVVAMPLDDDGAGIAPTKPRLLLESSHSSFRPVDIQIGPSGAIYIADWFNPIIGHYQASFRHPDRDKTHGRIWRMTAKGRPLQKAPAVHKMSAGELCDQLASDERWVRYHAKRRLANLPREEVLAAVREWLVRLDKSDANYEHHLYEALGVFESHETVDRPLLERLLASKEPRARAYAARVVGRWHDRLDAPLSLLEAPVTDPDIRVRMEAVVAASSVRVPRAVTIVAKASSLPRDRFIDYSMQQAIRTLSDSWLPALEQGELKFEQPEHLVYTLRTSGRNDIAQLVRRLVASETTGEIERRELLKLLSTVGDNTDVAPLLRHAMSDAELLAALVTTSQARTMGPVESIEKNMRELMGRPSANERVAAVRLAGLWKQALLKDEVKLRAFDEEESAAVRAAAILSLSELGPQENRMAIRALIHAHQPAAVRLAALEAMSRIDLPVAAAAAIALLGELQEEDKVAPVINIVMRRRGAAEALAAAIDAGDISTDDAKLISRHLSASGHDNAKLNSALKKAIGITSGAPLEYSDQLVSEIADEVRTSGDAEAGRKLFHSALANCAACHQASGDGSQQADFMVGPDLGAVGAGLQLELIVEAVVWPQRQIKEGFNSTTLFLNDGRVLTGYVLRDNGVTVAVRDLVSGKVKELATQRIEERKQTGSAMPAGFIDTLTRQELRDLVRYLSERKSVGSR